MEVANCVLRRTTRFVPRFSDFFIIKYSDRMTILFSEPKGILETIQAPEKDDTLKLGDVLCRRTL